jgi:hypothetical protein
MAELPQHEFSAGQERAMRVGNRSSNVDDRRDETRAAADKRMADETVNDLIGLEPNDRVSDGFSALGKSSLAKQAGIDNIGGE